MCSAQDGAFTRMEISDSDTTNLGSALVRKLRIGCLASR